MHSAEQAHWCTCSWNWYSESQLGSEWVYLQVSCRQEVTHYRVVHQVTALRLTNELCHKSQQKHRWHTTICPGIINKEITRQALLIEINITGMQVKNRFKWEYFSKVLYDASFFIKWMPKHKWKLSRKCLSTYSLSVLYKIKMYVYVPAL